MREMAGESNAVVRMRSIVKKSLRKSEMGRIAPEWRRAQKPM